MRTHTDGSDSEEINEIKRHFDLALSLKTLFTASNYQIKVCLYSENNREEKTVGANAVENTAALVYTVILILTHSCHKINFFLHRY